MHRRVDFQRTIARELTNLVCVIAGCYQSGRKAGLQCENSVKSSVKRSIPTPAPDYFARIKGNTRTTILISMLLILLMSLIIYYQSQQEALKEANSSAATQSAASESKENTLFTAPQNEAT